MCRWWWLGGGHSTVIRKPDGLGLNPVLPLSSCVAQMSELLICASVSSSIKLILSPSWGCWED